MKNGIIFLIFLILSLPVRAENFTDEQALLHYSVNGKSDSIEEYLKKGVDPNTRTKSGNTALMEAAVARNMKSIRILLEYNADPTLKNKKGKDYSSSSCSLPNSSSVSTP